MGSLSDIIDFDKIGMAKKVTTHKRQDNGLETHRNSLELPAGSFQTICVDGDFTPYFYHMKSNWSEKQNMTQFPIKKMIVEKTSKGPTVKHNAPSVVARLMGVDVLPTGPKAVAQKVERKHEVHDVNLSEESLSKDNSIGRFTFPSKSTRHKRFTSFDYMEGHIVDQCCSDRGGNKPKPREHPQEEELQKFKKEFEAWQVARVREIPEAIELGITPSQWLAQENLNKEKMVCYANSTRMVKNLKPLGQDREILKSASHERDGLQNTGMQGEYSAIWENDSFHLKKRNQTRNTKLSFLQTCEWEAGSGLAPSEIVVLKPGVDTNSTCVESCLNSPSTSLEKGSMEDFLEQVKERLNYEVHGKAYIKTTTARGGGIETPYSEKPSDPNVIARHIAKHVRKTRNLGMNLFRSQSTKSYGSKNWLKEANAPEYLSKDTTKFMVQRNVAKVENHQHVPLVHGSTKPSMLSNQRWKTKKSREFFNQMNKVSYLDVIESGLDRHSRSFRHEANHDRESLKELSPMKLTRSLSAPLSGKSFEKLLFEDRHMLTGAHVRRKHEDIEKTTVYENKQKKEKFNLKEKVTSLKNSFMIKGRLFGRRVQLSEELDDKHDPMNDFCTSMIMSPSDRHENSTEVPPSPASLCVSVLEESWQPSEYFSPPPVSDVASPWDSTTPNAFREISSNLEELRRQLNQLETDGSEDTMVDEQHIQADLADIEDQDESYIRDLLLVSGLYDGSWERSLSRWDTLDKPINTRVFEEVEDSCRKKMNTAKNQGLEVTVKDQSDKSNHKILFDLVNESLAIILGPPPSSMSKFMRNTTSPLARPQHGKKLLDQLWQRMLVYLHPYSDRSHFSLDSVVAEDMQSTPWWRLDDDSSDVGKDIECYIVEDLIDEILKEIQSLRSLS